MKVLLSIKPEYVELMTKGEKLFEYRKRLFKEHVDSVVVYATKPVGKIIGEFTIEKVINDSPQRLWDQTNEFSGVSTDFFMNYFQNREIGFALKIKEFTEYEKPISPGDIFENFIAPQSYKYIENDFLEKAF